MLRRFLPSEIPALRRDDVEDANGLVRALVLRVTREAGVDGTVRVFVGLVGLCLTKGFRSDVGEGCMVERREPAVPAVALVEDVLVVEAKDIRLGFALSPLAFFSSPDVAASVDANEARFWCPLARAVVLGVLRTVEMVEGRVGGLLSALLVVVFGAEAVVDLARVAVFEGVDLTKGRFGKAFVLLRNA